MDGAGHLIILLAAVSWIVVWGGLSAAIWSAKGGSGLLAFASGAFFGIFAVAYFAFATPTPPASVEHRAYPGGHEPAPDLPRWRDRRLGTAGWVAVIGCLVAIIGLLLTAPAPGK